MRSTNRKRWISIVSVALIAAACTGGATPSAPGGTSTTYSSPSPVAAPSTSPTPPRSILSLAPAPYRLAAPVQREVAVLDGKVIYLAGGLDASGVSAAGVFSLDHSTGRLTAVGSMPNAFHDAAGAMIGGRLYVFGGSSTAGTNLVQAFDPATRTGAVAGRLPLPLSDLSAATVGDTVYLVGGYDGVSPRSEIYATTDGRSFRTVGALPKGLRYPAVTAVGTTLVIAGGQAAAGLVDTVSVFDTTSGAITSLGTLPAPTGHASAFTIGGLAYIAGGQDPSGATIRAVVSIDPATGRIQTEHPLRRPLADAAAVSTSGGALIFGGERGPAVADVIAATLVPANGSDPATPATDASQVRPFAGLLLIADRGNNRLLVVNAKKHVVWRYPSPSLPPPPNPFYFPDDAFWVHGGNAILVNEEENDTLALIAYPSGKTLWTYGHAKTTGSGPGFLNQPDDVYPYPGGGMIVSDALNCRILFFNANGDATHQIGTTGDCTHDLPHSVGYPNGDTPLPNGHILISELNGAWIDEVTPTGHIVWSTHVPGVTTPSDPQPMPDGSYMVANYASPGGVFRFDSDGTVLWSYQVASGHGRLDHPSLALPLPNGLVAVNDDYNHRVVIIDPATNRIVWQYGTGASGSGRGQLSFPDGMDLLLPGNVIPLRVDFPSSVTRAGRP